MDDSEPGKVKAGKGKNFLGLQRRDVVPSLSGRGLKKKGKIQGNANLRGGREF